MGVVGFKLQNFPKSLSWLNKGQIRQVIDALQVEKTTNVVATSVGSPSQQLDGLLILPEK